LSDPAAALAALDAALAADRAWIEALGQATSTADWQHLLEPAWPPAEQPPEGRC
jgi:hypothetical protein